MTENETDDAFESFDARMKQLYADMESGKPFPKRSPEYEALVERVVKGQAELNARLNSSDPKIRENAKRQVIRGGVAFIMGDGSDAS